MKSKIKSSLSPKDAAVEKYYGDLFLLKNALFLGKNVYQVPQWGHVW
jgi:hypothetical protein